MMTESNSPQSAKPRVLSARRIALLATVAGIGAALLVAGPNGYWPSPFGTPSAQAADATVQHPTGFAEIVAKVKPAVSSVRVQISGSAEPAMMQQFGQNNDNNNDDQQQ